jgi:hypothetical protein
MSTLVSQADLEAMFTAERVAEVFCVQTVAGGTTGVVDSTSLTMAIRMGSAEAERVIMGAYGSSFPYTADTCPDTLKQLVGVLVMHQGMLRRPDCMAKPDKSPYFEAWKQARADLKDLREGFQRLSTTDLPANVGGQVSNHNPTTSQPFFFVPDATGSGGFNSGGF